MEGAAGSLRTPSVPEPRGDPPPRKLKSIRRTPREEVERERKPRARSAREPCVPAPCRERGPSPARCSRALGLRLPRGTRIAAGLSATFRNAPGFRQLRKANPRPGPRGCIQLPTPGSAGTATGSARGIFAQRNEISDGGEPVPTPRPNPDPRTAGTRQRNLLGGLPLGPRILPGRVRTSDATRPKAGAQHKPFGSRRLGLGARRKLPQFSGEGDCPNSPGAWDFDSACAIRDRSPRILP
jgi:hypothetical protein